MPSALLNIPHGGLGSRKNGINADFHRSSEGTGAVKASVGYNVYSTT